MKKVLAFVILFMALTNSHAQQLTAVLHDTILVPLSKSIPSRIGHMYGKGQNVAISANYDEIIFSDYLMGTKMVQKQPYTFNKFNCEGSVTPIHKSAKYILYGSERKIVKYNDLTSLDTIDIGESLDRIGTSKKITPANVGLNWLRAQSTEREYVFGLIFHDAGDVNGKQKFLKYPLFGTFDFQTHKFKYIGAFPDTFKSKLKRYCIYSFAYFDTLTNNYIAGVNNSSEILAYNKKGILIKRATVPDSVKKLLPILENNPSLQQEGILSNQKATYIQNCDSKKYYGLTRILRLNQDMVAAEMSSKEEMVYVIYSNNLKYLGLYRQSRYVPFMYHDKRNTYFYTQDKDRNVGKVIPVTLSLSGSGAGK